MQDVISAVGTVHCNFSTHLLCAGPCAAAAGPSSVLVVQDITQRNTPVATEQTSLGLHVFGCCRYCGSLTTSRGAI
jgi:hypothetical protein